MNSQNYSLMRHSGKLLGAGVLALSLAGVVLAQNATPGPDTQPDQSSVNQPAATAPGSGWKRVGDGNAQQQNAAAYPNWGQNVQAPQNGNGDPNQPAPYAGQNQPAPPPGQAPGASANPYPGNQPYPPPGYGQQAPNGQQPAYGQQPYGQQTQGNYPPPPPVPAQLTLQPGTYATVRVNQLLSSDKNQQGDAFTATLEAPLVVNGVVVAEPGQTVGGRVVSAEKHGAGHSGRLGLQITNLTLVDGQQIPVTTQFVSRTGGTTPGGAEAGTVIGTTAIGAAIGAAAGWGTGAAIGAGAGAAAGLIGVLVTHNHASVVYPEQVLTFRIEAPVTISTERSAQAFRYVQPNEYDRAPNMQGPGTYATQPAPPTYYAYGGGYPYYGYPYSWYGGSPYWGPTFAFYGGWWGGRYYGRPYGYRGGGYYGRGYVGGGRVYAGGVGHVGGGVAVHGGGGHR